MANFGARTDLTRQARALIEARQPQAAKKLLREAVDSFSRDAEAWALLSACHGMLGEYAECERCCRRVIDIESRAYTAWGNLGNALKFQDRGAEAEKAYRKALKIEPRYAEGHNNLGNLLRERGEHQEAERCYRTALTLQPDYPDALTNLGALLQERDKNEEAIACYQRALTLYPQHPDALTNLGSALLASGRLAEAMQVFERLVNFYQVNVKGWGALGSLCSQHRQYERSIECSQKALALNPNYAASYHTMGLTYQALKNYDKAEEMFRKALALDPIGMESAHFYLSAMGRESIPDQAPENFVKQLFDEYAERFDRHLVEKLAYQTPQLLGAAVRSILADTSVKLDVLDLGCGTGLSGEPFRDIAHRLTGVDLSPKMIAKAKARNIYDKLIVGDILTPLATPGAAFDLIVAADVFVYIGDLTPVFRACKSALQVGGLFAFSTEAEDGDGTYVLRPSGRYAHTLGYLHALAEATGFLMVATNRVILRTESEQPITGNLCILRRQA